ncbi:MAG: hypothetical protein KAQ62_03215, partial [Cyclobacteriaceae bacterium]|nr:hypothetical protein [Cyclobacteriaceae bacterium]
MVKFYYLIIRKTLKFAHILLRFIISMRLIKRLVVFYSVAFCGIPNLFGQVPELSNPYIDSLKQQIDFVSDSAKVDILNKIAYNYYYY